MRQDIVRALKLIGEDRRKVEHGAVVLSPSAEPMSLDAALVQHMVSEGLLERRRDVVSRSQAGRAYLKRALSGGEFADQHRVPVARQVEDRAVVHEVTVNARENPLDWLATRRDRSGTPMISQEQFKAGDRLRADFENAFQRERVTQAWDASGVRSEARRDRLTVSEAANDARRRVEGALAAVGEGLCEVLVAVVCEERGLEAVEKANGWPQRCAKVVLRLALDRLAAHYGIAASAVGAGSPLTHWGATDYRPSA